MSDIEVVLAHRAALATPVTAAEKVVADLVAAQARLDQQLNAAVVKAATAAAAAEDIGKQRVALQIRIDEARGALAEVRKPLDAFDAQLQPVRDRLQ